MARPLPRAHRGTGPELEVRRAVARRWRGDAGGGQGPVRRRPFRRRTGGGGRGTTNGGKPSAGRTAAAALTLAALGVVFGDIGTRPALTR